MMMMMMYTCVHVDHGVKGGKEVFSMYGSVCMYGTKDRSVDRYIYKCV